MVILIKEFYGKEAVERRNEFARTKKIIADQTHLDSRGFVKIFSFYEELN